MDFQQKRFELLEETKLKISASIGADEFITQAINAIGEIDKAANILARRLREWYELYYPEFSKKMSDHEKFVEGILKQKFPLKIDNSMGGQLEQIDLDALTHFTQKLHNMYQEKDNLTKYIEIKMKARCPRIQAACGTLIGAKLLAHKGTLKELAFMPASTIQLLGAEKALFRHLRSNARSPKYGHLLQHQEVAQAKNKGKVARQLANKISIAAKQDYFTQEGNPNNVNTNEVNQ